MTLLDQVKGAGGRWAAPICVDGDRFAKRWKEHALEMFGFLREPIPIVNIDNVSAYYYEGTDQEYWDIRRDFPNLAPPWQMFWMESKIIQRLNSRETGHMTNTLCPNGRIGFLVFYLPAEDVGAADLPEGTKWVMMIEQWVDYAVGHPIIGPHGLIAIAIDSTGGMLDTPRMTAFVDSRSMAGEMKDFLHSLIGICHPVLLAITFLHCKNVTVVDQPVPPKLAKRTFERHGIRPSAHKRMIIEPLKQILRHEGGSDKHGLAKAMHICRGHFRDYRQGAGLFGKYKQMVWTPMTVRGTKGKSDPAREIEIRVGERKADDSQTKDPR